MALREPPAALFSRASSPVKPIAAAISLDCRRDASSRTCLGWANRRCAWARQKIRSAIVDAIRPVEPRRPARALTGLQRPERTRRQRDRRRHRALATRSSSSEHTAARGRRRKNVWYSVPPPVCRGTAEAWTQQPPTLASVIAEPRVQLADNLARALIPFVAIKAQAFLHYVPHRWQSGGTPFDGDC
jgi:hypothetical protein